MFRKIVSAIIIVPLVVILIGFAVANRQIVSVSFDPFDQAHPAYALTLPLFAVVFVLLILGVVIGGAAAWLRQSHWRRAARDLDREARELRAELETLRRQAEPQMTPSGSSFRTAQIPPPDIMPPIVP